jgi:DNA polymerase-3 subunit gamma/tau
MTLANRHRPKTFAELIGQESEAEVVKAILKRGWKPAAIMANGPFGTGKTTFARLIARAILCDSPQYGLDQAEPSVDQGKPYEPCGVCPSCKAMDQDAHPNYTEVDAASNGQIADVRAMKDSISYKVGSKIQILTYDESHGLSTPAQNALLQTLEEGNSNILFIFATTDPQRMLPTIKSRCTLLNLKLLSKGLIHGRILAVANREGIEIEDAAAALIATYVRGHVRDALILLEQLHRTANGPITADLTRTYLRLDKFDDIYQLLTLTDKKEIVARLETLLCNYAPSELAEIVGDVLINAYKLSIGFDDFTQVDIGWLQRIGAARPPALCLDQAEAILKLDTGFASISYGIAAFTKILVENDTDQRTPLRTALNPGAAAPAIPQFRKPGK